MKYQAKYKSTSVVAIAVVALSLTTAISAAASTVSLASKAGSKCVKAKQTAQVGTTHLICKKSTKKNTKGKLVWTVVLPVPNSPRALSGTPIKIGVAVPLTGSFAAGGPSEQYAAQLAVEEYNSAGGYKGRPVQLIIRDDQTDPQTGIAVVQNMIQSQGVVAIIGSGSSGPAIPESAQAQNAGVTYISCASSDLLTVPRTDGAKSYVFRSAFSALSQTQAMLNFIKSRSGSKIGIIYEATGFGIPAEATSRSEAAKLGLNIVSSESVPAGETRLEPALQRLKDKGVNMLMAWQVPAGLVATGNGLKTIGWSPNILASYAATNPGFLKTSGSLVDGMILPNAYLPDAKASAQTFETNFEARFGSDPWPVFSALYYDATRLLLGALTKVGPDRNKLRDALESTMGFQAITQMPAAPFTRNNHDAIQASQLFLTKITGSRLTLIKP